MLVDASGDGEIQADEFEVLMDVLGSDRPARRLYLALLRVASKPLASALLQGGAPGGGGARADRYAPLRCGGDHASLIRSSSSRGGAGGAALLAALGDDDDDAPPPPVEVVDPPPFEPAGAETASGGGGGGADRARAGSGGSGGAARSGRFWRRSGEVRGSKMSLGGLGRSVLALGQLGGFGAAAEASDGADALRGVWDDLRAETALFAQRVKASNSFRARASSHTRETLGIAQSAKTNDLFEAARVSSSRRAPRASADEAEPLPALPLRSSSTRAASAAPRRSRSRPSSPSAARRSARARCARRARAARARRSLRPRARCSTTAAAVTRTTAAAVTRTTAAAATRARRRRRRCRSTGPCSSGTFRGPSLSLERERERRPTSRSFGVSESESLPPAAGICSGLGTTRSTPPGARA